jgi:hypothetical protein
MISIATPKASSAGRRGIRGFLPFFTLSSKSHGCITVQQIRPHGRKLTKAIPTPLNHLPICLRLSLRKQPRSHLICTPLNIRVWQGVAAIPYLSMPCGQATPERPNGCLRGSLSAGPAACGSFLPFWTPHAVCCINGIKIKGKFLR